MRSAVGAALLKNMDNKTASRRKQLEKILLCRRRGIMIENYCELETNQDREALAAFICDRFCERYIDSQLAIPEGHASGFAVLGLSSLVIEALEGFRRGWSATDDRRAEPFQLFFAGHASFEELREPYAAWFYQNIRCGILHIGESKRGWLIHFNDCDPLFNRESLTVNAKKFVVEVRAAVCDYAEQLRKARWDDGLWTNFRSRMKETVEACQEPQGRVRNEKAGNEETM